jgi:hypothetical protein
MVSDIFSDQSQSRSPFVLDEGFIALKTYIPAEIAAAATKLAPPVQRER